MQAHFTFVEEQKSLLALSGFIQKLCSNSSGEEKPDLHFLHCGSIAAQPALQQFNIYGRRQIAYCIRIAKEPSIRKLLIFMCNICMLAANDLW